LADPTAGDLGDFVVNGLTEYDNKSAPRRAYRAWFYSGDPTKFDLKGTPPSKYGRQRYDAFGRQVESYGLDGKVTLASLYHALSSDVWDAADLTIGAHYGTPASIRKDGHGRTVATTERIHVGTGIESREIRTQYLPTGEAVVISRVRIGASDPPVVRWMRFDSLGRMVLNVEPNTTKNFNADPTTDPSTMKGWRYAFDDAGDVVGTSDARGCGSNYTYDSGGRLVSEDYSPCSNSHALYSAPDFLAETGIEVLYRYDTVDADTTDAIAAGCAIDSTLLRGRLVSVADRGAKTLSAFDGRGRRTCVARKLAKPGVPSDALASRYAPSWYVVVAKFDGSDRATEESTGASASDLMGGDGTSRVLTSYTKRGTVKEVGSTYGSIVARVVHDADGLAESITYGDIAATKTAFEYDDKRRLRSVQTYRGPPSLWTTTTSGYTSLYGSTTPSTFQLLLQDLDFTYDEVDNPIEIRDWRMASEWPTGGKPVTRKLEYDDLYRVSKIRYEYPGGGDNWVSPFDAENNGTATDPKLSRPSPHVSFLKRVQWQTVKYDWLGNTTNTDDDAQGFYDRSLGTITNGTASSGPYQLKTAANDATPGARTGHLTAKYDDAGSLVSMAVKRDGTCLPSAANCSQRFVYEWDEPGRLVRARRWDLSDPGAATDAIPSGTPTAELMYTYDSVDRRVRKTSIDPAGASRHTLYPLMSLEVRRAEWTGTDYARTKDTEVPYLFAHGVRLARIAYEPSDTPSIPTLSTPRLHVFIQLADHLGSTDIVVDKDTSELVERSTYQASGTAESDYRPSRWKSFREDHRFTGKEEDVEVGVFYFGARFYSPHTGRWLSADPLAIHALGGTLNLYAYVNGQLLRAIDPLGLEKDGNLLIDLLLTTNPIVGPTWGLTKGLYKAHQQGQLTQGVAVAAASYAAGYVPGAGQALAAISGSQTASEAKAHVKNAIDAWKRGDRDTAFDEALRAGIKAKEAEMMFSAFALPAVAAKGKPPAKPVVPEAAPTVSPKPEVPISPATPPPTTPKVNTPPAAKPVGNEMVKAAITPPPTGANNTPAPKAGTGGGQGGGSSGSGGTGAGGAGATKPTGGTGGNAPEAHIVSGVTVPNGKSPMTGNVDVGPTLSRIRTGGSFPHPNDGSVFMNKEGLLPVKPLGYYREWVHPTPGVSGPGPQRIVTGSGGEVYYTPDHYKTFVPLK